MKIINVSKKFIDGNKEKIAVNNINLTLNKGLTFFVGKSGSGKSTLLNLIAGFDLPSTGSIVLDDVDITKLNNNESKNEIKKQENIALENNEINKTLVSSSPN